MGLWSTDSQLKRRIKKLERKTASLRTAVDSIRTARSKELPNIYEVEYEEWKTAIDREVNGINILSEINDIKEQLQNFDEWAQQMNRKFMMSEPKQTKEDKSMKKEKKELLDRYFQYLDILQEGNREPSTSNSANIKDIKEKIENLLEDENNRLKYKENK